MNADCAVCGSLWRRDVLSLPRPECPSCEKGICSHCAQVRCADCQKLIHTACAHEYHEERYCPACAARVVKRDLVEIRASMVEALTLEERLVASIAIAKYRKDAA